MPQEVKQIAGRAGRFNSAFEYGEVLCMDDEDVPTMINSMEAHDRNITRAGSFDCFCGNSIVSNLPLISCASQ
jgi:ATP-dependent RNA helicase SUPV3L1/SUV3